MDGALDRLKKKEFKLSSEVLQLFYQTTFNKDWGLVTVTVLVCIKVRKRRRREDELERVSNGNIER